MEMEKMGNSQNNRSMSLQEQKVRPHALINRILCRRSETMTGQEAPKTLQDLD
jgi:hypothetical protein